MVKKEFTYTGLTLDELKNLSLNELSERLPARQRRSLKRGLCPGKKKFLKKTENKVAKTHHREMIVTPSMVGKVIRIHNGKEFGTITVLEEMIGHRVGEFVFTRKRTAHSSPGVGASKSSSKVSVK
ncbi:30S ribosomal protein S19 [Candidatus Woesearchaeota archaeon]|nr:30S ribosomal protein S19 [Candidatus Woesearchaeota archaeon]|tara:strand:- start:27 stop:404 length:378 start_codon:yes stop_codon:yes gene_type:complete